MLLVPLRDRSGRVVAESKIDDEDVDQLAHRWHLTHYGYAGRTLWIPRTNAERPIRGLIWLHREIAGAQRRQRLPQVDHINGDRLDNRRANLRLVRQSVNLQNRRSRPGSTSKYVGVSWYAAYSKWAASVTHDGRRYFLGYFTDELAAAAAVESRMQELRGPAWSHR